MVARPADIAWLDADEAELVEIEPIDEHVDRPNRVVLGDIVIEPRGEHRRLPPVDPFHKSSHRSPRRVSLGGAYYNPCTFSHGLVESRTGAVAWGQMAITPFPILAHQTGRADLRHPAFRLASQQAHGVAVSGALQGA